MAITIEAVYENGVLKPVQPLALSERQRVQVTVHGVPGVSRRAGAVVPWTGSIADLDFLINDAENDPLEGP